MSNSNRDSEMVFVTRLWCLALLALAGLQAAEAQVGAYGLQEAAYAYTSQQAPGAYSLQETPGAYGLQESAGAYSFQESAGPVGGYGFQEAAGAYSLRRLLADELDTPPASANDFDIIPQDVPMTRSWDSRTAQSWDEWYADHFGNSNSNAGSATTSPQYGAALGYGYGSIGQYGYAMGSEVDIGAYALLHGDKAYVPAVIHDDEQQQPLQEQASAPDAARETSGPYTLNVEQVDPTSEPAIAGVSRGRGTAVQQQPSSTDVPSQQGQLPESAQAVQLALMEPVVSPVLAPGRLGRALRAFSRKLHISKDAAEEALWAFRQ